MSGDVARATFRLSGRVQGVGMRAWVQARALALGLRGYARNEPDGTVEVVAEGPREQIERLAADLRRPARGRIDDLAVAWAPATGEFRDFRVG